MTKTTRKIAVKKTLPKRKRICAYARVSSGKDAMLHSLSAQVSHYSQYIQYNPEWEYVGVYMEMLPRCLIQMHPRCTQTAP